MFLHQHPGWTWRDLQDAPYQVVVGLTLIDTEVARARARAAS